MKDVLIFSDEDPVRVLPPPDKVAALRAERDRLYTNIMDGARQITALRQQVASLEKVIEEMRGDPT